MQTLDFLQRVLPPEGTGFYVGHAQHPQQGVRHQSFRSIERLVQWLQFWESKQFNCYFAVAAFELETVYDQVGGKWQLHRRSKANKPRLMNFHQDIDTRLTHEKAAYAHPEDAARAVLSFCAAHGLPAPIWVLSGGGLHIYWHLAACLDMGAWEILARGLKWAMLDFGVAVDKARAADPTSILRVPGTHHWRSGNIVTCGGQITAVDISLFEQFREKGLSDDRAGSQASGTYPQVLQSASPLARAVAGGIFDEPSSMRVIAARCAQIGHFACEPGRYSEPFQRGVAGLARHCGERGFGEYLAWIAPEYHTLARSKAAGWHGSATTCDYFRENSPRPEACEACPVKDQIRSPIVLGRPDFDWPQERPGPAAQGGQISDLGSAVRIPSTGPAAQIESTRSVGAQERGYDPSSLNGFPVLSAPWGLDTRGRVVFQTEASGGRLIDTAVTGHPLYVASVHEAEMTGFASITLKHKLPHEDWASVNINQDALSDNRYVAELLKNHVVVHDPKLLKTYINEQVETINHASQIRMKRYEQCGWKDLGTDNVKFVHGAVVRTGRGDRQAATVSEDLMLRARNGLLCVPGGSASELVRVTQTLWPLDHYAAWFAFIASFTSICHVFFDRASGGCLIPLVGPTGGGKTKILRAACAVWSKWDGLAIKHYDTAPSMGLALAVAGNLPVFIDEMHHFTTDKQFGLMRLRAFIDMLAAGTDKHRALQSGVGVRQQLARFCLNALASSNQSIHDLIETSAQAMDGVAVTMRILELPGDPPRRFDAIVGDGIDKVLDANAGHAGDLFLNALLQPGVVKEFEHALHSNTDAIWRAAEFGAEQRYRMHTLGGIATAAPILRDLGLLPAGVDVPSLLQWSVEQVRSRSRSAAEHQLSPDVALEIIHDFFAKNVTNTLRVQFPYRSNLTQMAIGQRPQKLVIRQELNPGRAFAAVKDFKNFVVQSGYTYTDVLNFLEQLRIIVNSRRSITLGAGTEYASAQVPCIEVDTTHPAFGGLIKEVPNEPVRQLGP